MAQGSCSGTRCLELPFTTSGNDILDASGIGTTCPSIKERVSSLISRGREIARPIVFYQNIKITKDQDGRIIIDSIPLEGDLPGKNLEESDEVTLFIASCGSELQDWSDSLKDYFDLSVADAISDRALEAAMKTFYKTMKKEYEEKTLSIMTPGSVNGWPASELNKIFHFLGDAAKEKGIALGSTGMMDPLKTVSGILFAGDKKFLSCDHCGFKDCSLKTGGLYQRLDEETKNDSEKP